MSLATDCEGLDGTRNPPGTPPPRRPSRLASGFLAGFAAGLGLVLAAAASGCAARRPPPPPLPLDEADLARLIAETRAAAGAIRRYQAVLGVRGEGPRGRFSGRILLVFERPHRGEDPDGVAAMRMELFGPIGGPRWTLVARPGEVRVVVPAERAFADGPDLARFTEPLLGIPVGLEQAAALVVGTGVPVPEGEVARPAPDAPGGLLEGGGEIWWDDPAAEFPQVRRVVGEHYEARYPEAYRRDGRQVPREFEIESSEVEAVLAVEELRVNAVLHPDSFRLRTPSGFRRADASELADALRLPAR